MIDKKLYCETFSRLHASEEAKKEVFQMKEKRQKHGRMPRLLRTAAIAAVMVCALAVTASAVNLATDGVLFATLREVWSDGYETRYEAVDEDGNVMDLTVVAGSTITVEDGRMILHAVNEDIDITDEIAETGAYHREWAMERRTVTVDVSGTQEDWTLVEEVTDEYGNIYRSTFTSEDLAGGVDISIAAVGEDTDEDGAERFVTVTTSEDVEGTVITTADGAE